MDEVISHRSVQFIADLTHMGHLFEDHQIFTEFLVTLLQVEEDSGYLRDVVGKDEAAKDHDEGGHPCLVGIGDHDVPKATGGHDCDCPVDTVDVLFLPGRVVDAVFDHPIVPFLGVSDSQKDSSDEMSHKKIGHQQADQGQVLAHRVGDHHVAADELIDSFCKAEPDQTDEEGQVGG